MERMTKIGMVGVALIMLAACGKGIPSYDATGTFEATEVIVSAEAAGKLLRLEVEEGTRLKAGEEIGLVDTVQLYLKKLQLEASMKSVESQRPDLAKQIAATKQQIATAEREKKRVENQTQINLVMVLQRYMKGNEYEVLPSNIGLQDAASAGAIDRYNQMLVERKRLLRTSTENNPTIINLDTSIRAMRTNVQATLDATLKGLQITKEDLAREASRYSRRINDAPTQ